MGTLSLSQAMKLGLKLDDDEGLFSSFKWNNTHLENMGSVKEYFNEGPAGYKEHLPYDNTVKKIYGSEKKFFEAKKKQMKREAHHLSNEADHNKPSFPITDKTLDVNFEKDSIFRNKYEAE